ncbi:glycosyltransferase family 4 protein [Antarcticibacterium flavum]|uniref:Glycosyltransferase family 4 protein n=1 Tax=Antarcticibacterium flavum TaxID=2058175 RepID=A0A5B7WZY2_9FLAO|nr:MULTISPECIES: glycosyltransferase family 1 protein [Antarcticibacterium]MCM4160824.1 glycosyltransferase family 1 protein [Antarcticibacterium sp. W02-3]QCY67992.1 glycosyltransferase family 4 protein [Antarcticibacterium flavum]
MKIILIGNYPGDRQESMFRYLNALKDNLIRNEVQVGIIQPGSFFVPPNKITTSGLLKWLGYIDKYVVFPIVLKMRVMKELRKEKEDVFFHICDHSNSMYLKVLPKNLSGITCHDVLAIQGALGFDEAYCKATRTGKILQAWILSNLKKARKLATVSHNTMKHLTELCEVENGTNSNWKVIHNSFNSKFWPMDESESRKLLKTLNFPKGQFILHVGSGLPRKNRSLLLKMVKELGNRWKGYICFAGDPLDEDFTKNVKNYGILDRVKSVPRPDHPTLVALYSSCEAFIFPSFSEGFGWPLIEAQACGAPVIASSISTLQEVGGEAAIYANPYKPEDFAKGFIRLNKKEKKKELITLGFENCKRFDSQKLTKDFIKLYQS